MVGVTENGDTTLDCFLNRNITLDVFFAKGHSKCHKHLCNNKPFFPQIMHCYQCEETKHCKDLKSMNPQKCNANKEAAFDSCYTYIDGSLWLVQIIILN